MNRQDEILDLINSCDVLFKNQERDIYINKLVWLIDLWHENKLSPIRLLWNKYIGTSVEFLDNKERDFITEMWIAIKETLEGGK